jgi:hypothetical protein
MFRRLQVSARFAASRTALADDRMAPPADCGSPLPAPRRKKTGGDCHGASGVVIDPMCWADLVSVLARLPSNLSDAHEPPAFGQRGETVRLALG